MKYKSYVKKMTLLDTVLSTIADPSGTMRHLLLERDNPPYLLRTLMALFAVIILPSFIYRYHFGINTSDPSFERAVALSTLLTFIFFPLFMVLFLRVMGVTAPVIKIVAIWIYSLTPTIPFLLAYYALDYALFGQFTILKFFTTGSGKKVNWVVTEFPFFIKLTLLMCALVFSSGLKALGKHTMSSSIVMSLSSLGLLTISFWIGVTCSEVIFPNTAPRVTKFFSSFF